MSLISINPANSEVIAEYETLPAQQIESAINEASEAFNSWKQLSFDQRAERFLKLASLLEANSDALATIIALEMGKPIQDGRAEINKSAKLCRYYAENAGQLLHDVEIKSEAKKSYVSYQPLGVILGIMPWNFPVWQVLRYSVPVMMAGNTTLLKHANNVTGTAMKIQELFLEAGFPENAFRFLAIDIPETEKIIAHKKIAGVTLTGSVNAGRAVASQAGKFLKPVVLELGGSDPLLILEDADIDLAIEQGVKARLLVSGQVCISPKRFIVPEKLLAEIEQKVIAEMHKAKVGNPLLETTDFGPLARKDLKENLARQIEMSVQQGARLLSGNESGEHCFYSATVLSDVKPGQVAFEEELFGPVIALVPASSEKQAIALANQSNFGLGASIFSRDLQRAEQIARNEIEAGCCFVNTPVRSDARLPFGGVKNSGFGRELGPEGLKSFTNIKTIYLENWH